LSKSHPITCCNIKKEFDKILVYKKTSITSSASSGTLCHLHHIKEEVVEDAIDDVHADVMLVPPSNDTYENDLY
jgi:hypothetical protein